MNVNHPGSIKIHTPYMLRNDGEIFACDDIHPYIDYDVDDDFNYLLLEDGNYALWWIWFYEHTQVEDVKELIEKCLKILYSRWKVGAKWLPKMYERKVFPYFSIDEKDLDETATIDDFVNTATVLNGLVNQEFLRFRIGGYLINDGNADEIYMRVSSDGFNWFNLIWTLVYRLEKSDGLKYITITKDRQATGSAAVIRCKGLEVDHLDVKTFIELSGNPIVEKLDRYSNNRIYLKK